MIRNNWYLELADRLKASSDEATELDELVIILTLLRALDDAVMVEEKKNNENDADEI